MKRRTTSFGSTILGLACLVTGAGGATATTMCVSCVGPDATYRCVPPAAASANDARYQVLCITEIAKIGGHQSCSVTRNATGPCEGAEHIVGLDPEVAPGVTPQGTVTPSIAATPADTPPPSTQPGDQAPPKTGQTDIPKSPPPPVDEMAKQASENTPIGKAGKAVENTGKAIGKAATKTWNCLSSLFSDC